MKRLERIILILVAALVLAGLGVGLSTLFRHRADPVQTITQRDLSQAAAIDPNGPQMSLWRTDPSHTVLLFGKAVKTGAFSLTRQPPATPVNPSPAPTAPSTLRELVLERGGGFAPDAAGNVHVARKIDGVITTIAQATKAQLLDPAWPDVPLLAGDVVYAE